MNFVSDLKNPGDPNPLSVRFSLFQGKNTAEILFVFLQYFCYSKSFFSKNSGKSLSPLIFLSVFSLPVLFRNLHTDANQIRAKMGCQGTAKVGTLDLGLLIQFR